MESTELSQLMVLYNVFICLQFPKTYLVYVVKIICQIRPGHLNHAIMSIMYLVAAMSTVSVLEKGQGLIETQEHHALVMDEFRIKTQHVTCEVVIVRNYVILKDRTANRNNSWRRT